MRRMLLQDPTVNGYVVGKVFRYRLEEKVDGTSGMAVVLVNDNGWATPNPVTTQEYPILQVRCYADPTRGPLGEISQADALDKAWALTRAIEPLIHGKRDVIWGRFGSSPGLRIITAQRWAEPWEMTDEDRHNTSEDPLGDSVYVATRYALQVVH